MTRDLQMHPRTGGTGPVGGGVTIEATDYAIFAPDNRVLMRRQRGGEQDPDRPRIRDPAKRFGQRESRHIQTRRTGRHPSDARIPPSKEFQGGEDDGINLFRPCFDVVREPKDRICSEKPPGHPWSRDSARGTDTGPGGHLNKSCLRRGRPCQKQDDDG